MLNSAIWTGLSTAASLGAICCLAAAFRSAITEPGDAQSLLNVSMMEARARGRVALCVGACLLIGFANFAWRIGDCW